MNTSMPDPAYLAESRATEVIIWFSIPIPIIVLTTILRLYVRLATIPRSRLKYDDYLIVCAAADIVFQIASLTASALGLAFGPPYGFGQHLVLVPPDHFKMFMMGNYIFSHFYNLAIATAKLSVLALYHRLFWVKLWFRRLVIFTSVFVTVWLLSMELVLLFGWQPISDWWSGTGEDFVHITPFGYFANITNF
ncbi:integral membrane protein PTH11-like [Apiospora kogelbergensis]|uniref:Integral membrane protein PTH11-like n=1 Tax=Apiospora kogelbergensis TaxID=1337665 RepID=A0AAW0Q9P4_9PEZI